MTALKKRIAVAGCGYSGMGVVRSLQDEGIEPVCFEKTNQIGGTWCYREEAVPGVPSIMPTTVINHSKELGTLSTFVPDKELPNYVNHKVLYRLFMESAVENDTLKYVRYNSEVVEVRRSPDYDETGRWVVAVKDTLTGSVTSDIYDGVVICVGHINIPKWPTYKTQDQFKGKIMHSHGVKGVSPYEGKNVVVVGMGCSGLDAACEISNVANQVYLSTRSGAHVVSRVGPGGYPFDYVLIRRYLTVLIDILPTNLLSWLIETFMLDSSFNSRLYTVRPKWHILSKDPVFNDHIPSKLMSGSIIQKGDIKTFTENGVIFDGESSVTPADVVIMATGYKWEFPFLEDGIDLEEEDRINLYKCVWPANLKHPTLGFVGFVLPFGPGFPIGELQCRWVAHVFAGKGKLPSKADMLKDIATRLRKNNARYGPNDKQSIRVDFTQYMDELADEIGAKPDFLKMLFTDPKLFYKLIFGPCVPYQYRLQGPHPWSGAREAIMTCDERVHWPLNKQKVKRVEHPVILFLKKLLVPFIPFL